MHTTYSGTQPTQVSPLIILFAVYSDTLLYGAMYNINMILHKIMALAIMQATCCNTVYMFKFLRGVKKLI